MTPQQRVQALAALGWGSRASTALRDFQQGWNLGAPLVVDGLGGPRTDSALSLSLARLHAGHSTASAHFSFSEFACKCNGRYADCRRIVLRRELVAGLEVYRGHVGPMTIVAGYRCPSHNRMVGGATDSQHLYGGASDLEYKLPTRTVLGMRQFSGIGQSHSTQLVRHVDVRHVTGHNLTGGTPTRPTIWDYAK